MSAANVSSSPTFFQAMQGLLPAPVPSTVAYTEKGAVSLPTTQPPNQAAQVGARLNLFFKAVRGIDEAMLSVYLDESWKEDPLDTLRIIFQTRDCRGGKGERLLFRQMLCWLSKKDLSSLDCNMHLIPLYGRWDDVLLLPGGIDFMARQLIKDKAAFDADPQNARITLAAKWTPTERHALDKKYMLVPRIVRALGLMDDASGGITSGRTIYRKVYLSPLRKYLKLVERAMCAREWEQIDYSHVPSKAMKNYKKAFARHDEERFGKWTTALARDDKKTEDGDVVKVNAKQLFPHEIIGEYYANATGKVDVVTEEQWKVLVQDLTSAGTFEKSVCLCDVSGSMDGVPMLVSISLGILISSVTSEPFRNQIITFESQPAFHLVKGATLREKVSSLKAMPWGGSTQLQKAFDLILERAVQFRVSAENMPQRLYIFSDMQFDQACNCNLHTNFETMDAKYRKAGYKRPEVVFWNLRATESKEFPVTANENGVALLAGYSPSLLKSLMDGADLTPWGILRKILDNPRYSAITYAGEESDAEMVNHSDASSSSTPALSLTYVPPALPPLPSSYPVPPPKPAVTRAKGRGGGGRKTTGKRKMR